MVTIDLCKGVATSRSASVLGVEGEVTLPLVTIEPPKSAKLVRAEDPAVCLSSEVFDTDWETRLAHEEERRAGLVTSPVLHAAMADRATWVSQQGGEAGAAAEPADAPLPRHQVTPLKPHLTEDHLMRSAVRYSTAILGPWRGSRVEPWDAGAKADESGSWVYQRLYLDNNAVARLCTLLTQDEHKLAKVKFLRCGKTKYVPSKDLQWPDFAGVDQQWQHETQSFSTTWTTHARSVQPGETPR